ncbi:hypothetical protein FQN55_005263 [Onygenales sp. PD_40]|nr:hypothetical protein FQN55_005263 [Onygenales sp. PD_40]
MPSLSTLLPFTSSLTLPPPQAVQALKVTLPLLAISERLSFYPGHAILKLLSSAAFLAGPLYLTPSPSTGWDPYRTRIAAGLIFSAIGDYFLIPTRSEYYDKYIGALLPASGKSARDKAAKPAKPQPKKISNSFKLGVVSFAAAHVAYILAFLAKNQRPTGFSWSAFGVTMVLQTALTKWLGVVYPDDKGRDGLSSNVLDVAMEEEMKPLVFGYSLIISGMMAVANATAGSGAAGKQRLIGAVMFVISDIFVAKDAFGKQRGNPGLVAPAVGYGLYFWAQMVLAGTV